MHELWSKKWQQVLPLDSITVIELALEVVRAIQYLHSMGVAPSHGFDIGRVHLDSRLPKIRIAAECLIINTFMRSTSERSLCEDTVFGFGWFFYQVRLHPASIGIIQTANRNQIKTNGRKEVDRCRASIQGGNS
ncbi:hypothetical protein M378DRAFT_911983 [Amanita muscaria Koide BX008]|uniref:Protein kinase domain-containing protein n=1 Tax=Amanita muscaria (strain Koide BX008) TaxID=946122 RepID=A0A0C2WGQ3_AMAMK|nr:hypothetical protein M378DRAFT_911983 [Amanita muscaria Koide BX008]